MRPPRVEHVFPREINAYSSIPRRDLSEDREIGRERKREEWREGERWRE